MIVEDICFDIQGEMYDPSFRSKEMINVL